MLLLLLSIWMKLLNFVICKNNEAYTYGITVSATLGGSWNDVRSQQKDANEKYKLGHFAMYFYTENKKKIVNSHSRIFASFAMIMFQHISRRKITIK